MLDDREIREMMYDAEEKVPSRIWSAVSSRLDAGSGREKSPVWKWSCAGVAFAAAAALALILALPGTEDRKQEIDGDSVAVLMTAPSVDLSDLQETGCATVAVPEEKTFTASEQTQSSNPILPDSAVAEAVQPAVAEAVQSSVAEAVQPAVAEAVQEETVDVEGSGALLAKMEYEDTYGASVRSRDITFGGTLSGNTASRLTISRMSGGSGSVPTSDVISERSVSDFGIPFTLGLGFRWHISPKLAIGTGLDYSLLTRTFSGSFTAAGSTSSVPGDVSNSMHYIGIPLNLYYSLINTSMIDFYVYGGGEGEYCVNNKFQFRPSGADRITVVQKVKGPQFSVKLGVGAQFRLADHFSLYLDPGVSYYFYNAQPKSIRTERPLMFNFNAGFRFDLNN